MTVEQQIAEIKAHMPEVYKAIQVKANEVGKCAYALVRRGLRGEPNCFYAMERGRVVGTPFRIAGVSDVVARNMVEFGCTFLVVFPDQLTPPVGTPGAEGHAGNSTPVRAPVAGPGKSPVTGPKAGG